jgi:NADPH2:quinone reductase
MAMRAVVVEEFGGPEVLRLSDVEVPRPGPDEVTVDVDAAAVGLIDVLFRRDGLGGLMSPPFIPGIEVAGRVRETGTNIAGLRSGQPVVTLSQPGTAGYAEVACVPATLVIPLGNVDEQLLASAAAVAAVPNVVTALVALSDAARMAPGEDVLVHGATGGLGSVFPGVARALGAGRVVGSVSRADKIDQGRALGYDEMLLTNDLPASGSFHVVVDPVGGALRGQSLRLLRPLGRVVVVGNASGAEDVAIGANDLWLNSTAVVGLSIAGVLAAEPARAAALAGRAVELIRDGAVSVPYEVLPLDAAADAHRRLEARSVIGKLVLAPR